MAAPNSAQACAACFGRSDSKLAEGMNWGIFSLLAVVVFVLGGVAAFFIYLAKRAAASAGGESTGPEARAAASEPSTICVEQ
jgi:heme/copper-type cytochrome/quinol oxidase subunit 2